MHAARPAMDVAHLGHAALRADGCAVSAIFERTLGLRRTARSEPDSRADCGDAPAPRAAARIQAQPCPGPERFGPHQ